ncbi:excisionase [Marinobacterium litorale]|uniref:excisionase n=1 Tax=Marinobacterium litorale TaxID=404770 RepID=UPI0004036373|nr:excisionase [Marinobacterium litorale]
MQWLTLQEWDERRYAKPHSPVTLRKWASKGLFQPAARKVGREWLVREDATYCPPDNTTANLLRRAEAMIDHDADTSDLDPRVLEILSDGRSAA